MKIRASIATASLLGLRNYRIDAHPATLYFLLPLPCRAACKYCYLRQGKLGRVKWPEFGIEEIVKKIEDGIAGRICIQTTYNKKTLSMLYEFLDRMDASIPVSISINPISIEEMEMLKEYGVERLGFGIDACSEAIFKKWKYGTPSWKEYIEAIKNAKEIFGKATAHLIIGLGESDEEAINAMKFFSMNGIDIALFAYTKNNETMVELPRYRAIQIARYFIKEAEFSFKNGKLEEILLPEINKEAFRTSGCPDCNRPFYNERVTKIYNYPFALNELQTKKAMEEARKYARIYIAAGKR